MQHSAGVNAAHTFLEPLVEDVPHGGLRLAGRIHLGIVKEVDAVLERCGHALVSKCLVRRAAWGGCFSWRFNNIIIFSVLSLVTTVTFEGA